MIGILCGAFCVIALLLWAGIWYMRRKGGGGRRQDRLQNGTGSRAKGVNATLVSNGGSGDHVRIV